MKVFLDTNILLDWILHDRPFKEECEAILSAAKAGVIDVVVTTQSILDAHFTSKKAGIQYEAFERMINHLRSFSTINAIDWIDISWATSHYSGDLEDDAQYASAYNACCDFFITRDKKLMELNNPLNPMTVISPEEFVAGMME